jgi:hypothetical protein
MRDYNNDRVRMSSYIAFYLSPLCSGTGSLEKGFLPIATDKRGESLFYTPCNATLHFLACANFGLDLVCIIILVHGS